MLNRIKGAVASAIKTENADGKPPKPKTEKYVYARPYFLGLSREEVDYSRDFGIRPIFIPRDDEKTHTIPFKAGYAECINGGKSSYNEDNSFACVLRLRNQINGSSFHEKMIPRSPVCTVDEDQESSAKDPVAPLEGSYFGIFDGHAGHHVSLIASRLLHKHIQEKLEVCLEFLLQRMGPWSADPYNTDVSVDDLVTGALEEAFLEMDAQVDRESSNYLIKGGCTAMAVLFLKDKLYIANAGDCRAVFCQGETVTQVSTDFNPEIERQRLNFLGHSYPELLHDEFSCTEFARRVNKNDLGKRMLCRKPGMEGWVTKTITEEDLRFPLVTGEGRKARVMGTIGVTRGLGDHDLYVYDTGIWIKPFLSCKPEVRVIDLKCGTWTEQDVLIIGSDGLWDGVTNEQAVNIVRKSIYSSDSDNPNKKYTIAAQELICEARGSFTGHGWRKKDDSQASFDDITTFVIPIKPSVDAFKSTSKSTMAAPDNLKTAQANGTSVDPKHQTVDESKTNTTKIVDTSSIDAQKDADTCSNNNNKDSSKLATTVVESKVVNKETLFNEKDQSAESDNSAKQMVDKINPSKHSKEETVVHEGCQSSLDDGKHQHADSNESNCNLDRNVSQKTISDESAQ